MLTASLETDVKGLLLDCFATDKDLIEKWHIESGTDLHTCANRTYTDITNYNVPVYALKKDSSTVGYMGIADRQLYGFFIKPQYRTASVIKEFWDIVDSKMSGSYVVGIYPKNTPAKNFLLKRGELIEETAEALFFVMNRGD